MKRILAILLLLLPLNALAQQPDKAPDSAKIPVLEKLRGKGKDVTYDYLGQRYGTEAWLMSGPNLMQVIYTMPGQKTALVGGALVGPDAEELSSGLMKDFMKAQPQRAQEILAKVRSAELEKQVLAAKRAKTSPAENLWQDLAATGQVTYGNNAQAAVVYALVDPVQPATKEIWSRLGVLAKANHLTLHIVPLALTTGDSIMTIATILGNPDPNRAWEEMIEGKKVTDSDAPDPKGAPGMKATVELAQKMGFRQLPLLIYRLSAGDGQWGPVRMIKGLPKNWEAFLQESGAFATKDRPAASDDADVPAGDKPLTKN